PPLPGRRVRAEGPRPAFRRCWRSPRAMTTLHRLAARPGFPRPAPTPASLTARVTRRPAPPSVPLAPLALPALPSVRTAASRHHPVTEENLELRRGLPAPVRQARRQAADRNRRNTRPAPARPPPPVPAARPADAHANAHRTPARCPRHWSAV